MNRITALSLGAGVWVAVAFFIASVTSVFLVGGDGTAPAFTHVMLALANVPVLLFGFSKGVALLVAPVFWGALVAACIFALLQLVQALR